MTDAEFQEWLASPSAVRIVLIEAVAQVAGVETTFYLSTRSAYTTGAADTPANQIYKAAAGIGVLFAERLSLTGSADLSVGEVEIDNYNGERDALFGYVWANRPLRAYLGDPRWARADFRQIFDGIVADVAPSGRNKLVLSLRDKLQRLNTPLSEAKLGGSTQNKDALLPLMFGEGHNVTPLLIDPTNLIYQVHIGAIEDVKEVRDNDVPVSATVNSAAGTFTLPNQPFGSVTASVQGDKSASYLTTIAPLVQRLVTGFGKAADQFTTADLDTANFAAFDTAHPQPVGLWADERTNVLTACQQLAGSVGAQLSMSRLGKLRLIQLSLPAAGTPTAIPRKYMVQNTLVATQRTEVVASVKLGFAKNWTVQDGVITDIPEEHKNLFAQEWLTTTKTDTTVAAQYKLNAEPVQQDTLLLRRVDADAEAQRRLDLWKVPRTVYEFEGTPELLTLELGQAVTLYDDRYGMSDGVTGMVISLAPDWENAHVKVGVLV